VIREMMNFDRAPDIFASLIVKHLSENVCREGCIVRDVYGRLTFVTKDSLDQYRDSLLRLNETARQEIAGFLDSTGDIVVHVDRLLLSALRDEPYVSVGGTHLIDRRLAGEDWLMRPRALDVPSKRLIFYSVKGGVGRSTALAVTAADLASRGYNVLVIDFDLEAPALDSLLLTDSSLPHFGVIDWFAMVAAGADANSMLPDIVGTSPFTSPRAVVNVVPAVGSEVGDYLSKLARSYIPGSAGPDFAHLGFAKKAARLVDNLIAMRPYDAILIDSRAGLHETSGALLLGLGARVLLFGQETTQTFNGYNLLFSTFARVFDPALANEDLRGAFKMVHAKAPSDPKDRNDFIAKSWETWSENLYDDQTNIRDIAPTIDSFIFDLDHEDGPHYPLEIVGNEGYSSFDPRHRAYTLEQSNYEPVFGQFLEGVRRILDLS